MLSQYRGFVGLNVDAENFDADVMLPAEVLALFQENSKYEAWFAYPEPVANGFETPPVFFAVVATADNFILQADIESNQQPRGCLNWVASKLLPDNYSARDHLHFTPDAANGFGPGTIRITTRECLYPDGSEASCAKKLVSVENRPGLFLKIRDANGEVMPNVTIFFPDRATGLSHRAVRFGEAFVLARQDIVPSDELFVAISHTFNRLVNHALYTQGNNLFYIPNKKPIEECLPKPQHRASV